MIWSPIQARNCSWHLINSSLYFSLFRVTASDNWLIDIARRVGHVHVWPVFLSRVEALLSLLRTIIGKLLSRHIHGTRKQQCVGILDFIVGMFESSLSSCTILRGWISQEVLENWQLTGRWLNCFWFWDKASHVVLLCWRSFYIAYLRFCMFRWWCIHHRCPLAFTTSHKQFLPWSSTSLSIPLDWSLYLNGLGYFFLQRLLSVTTSPATLFEPASLIGVLYTHWQTLRHFGVKDLYSDNYRYSS